jgi:hypothetical protein
MLTTHCYFGPVTSRLKNKKWRWRGRDRPSVSLQYSVSVCLEKMNKNSPYAVTTSRMRCACLCDLAFLSCERLASLFLVRNVPVPNMDTHYPEVVCAYHIPSEQFQRWYCTFLHNTSNSITINHDTGVNNIKILLKVIFTLKPALMAQTGSRDRAPLFL